MVLQRHRIACGKQVCIERAYAPPNQITPRYRPHGCVDLAHTDQLSRLHLILKPFMLRRMKQDVEAEMPKKLEIEVMCRLSTRQK